MWGCLNCDTGLSLDLINVEIRADDILYEGIYVTDNTLVALVTREITREVKDELVNRS